MKVFLSWSKDRSKQIAQALADWLPLVVPGVHPFMSEQSLRAGVFHHEALRQEIQDAAYCIVCVTPENIREPWLNYEAGAIAERLNGRTCPYLFEEAKFNDLAPTPLSRLQGRKVNRDDTLSLVQEVASGLPVEYQPKRLDRVFGAFWQELEEKLKGIPKATEAPEPALKVDREAEVFQMIQGMRDQQTAMAKLLDRLLMAESNRRHASLNRGNKPFPVYQLEHDGTSRAAYGASGPGMFVQPPTSPTFPKASGGPDDGSDP